MIRLDSICICRGKTGSFTIELGSLKLPICEECRAVKGLGK